MDENIICRICLEVVPTGYSFQDNIQDLIKVLTSIEVSDHDDLPKLSCSKCIFNLYFVENIRNTIIKSDEKLHSLIQRDGSLIEILRKSTETQQNGDSINTADVCCMVIKEETFSPVNIDTEISDPSSAGRCDSIENKFNEESPLDEEISGETCTEETFDENDIRNIICKKNNNKPYLYHCNICNVDFQGNKIYMKHRGKHMKKTCEICGVTTRRDNFIKHMTKHKLGQQVCDICGSIHKSLEGLRTHLFHFHNAKKKPYVCGDCGESFKYSHRLSYHKRKIHTGYRPHQCDSCGKRFFDLGTLRKHIKLIHLKLREYHCKYCQKDYSSQYSLKVHTRQHTNETPYVCEICNEGFRQMISLKSHMAKHERNSTRKNKNEKEEEEDITS